MKPTVDETLSRVTWDNLKASKQTGRARGGHLGIRVMELCSYIPLESGAQVAAIWLVFSTDAEAQTIVTTRRYRRIHNVSTATSRFVKITCCRSLDRFLDRFLDCFLDARCPCSMLGWGEEEAMPRMNHVRCRWLLACLFASSWTSTQERCAFWWHLPHPTRVKAVVCVCLSRGSGQPTPRVVTSEALLTFE